jgi:hypothetical protein
MKHTAILPRSRRVDVQSKPLVTNELGIPAREENTRP